MIAGRTAVRLLRVPRQPFTQLKQNKKYEALLNPKLKLLPIGDPLFIFPAIDNKRYVHQMLLNMKRDNALEVNQSSLARACYNGARHDINEEYLQDLVQESLPLYKGNLKAREAFGMMYGALRLNYAKSAVYIAMSEIQRNLAIKKTFLSDLTSIFRLRPADGSPVPEQGTDPRRASRYFRGAD